MAHRTVERLREEIRRHLADILTFEARDPRFELATIMDVKLSGDMRHASVFVGVVGDETQEAETVRAFQDHAGFFRTELAKRVRLRHVPELHFRADDTYRRARRIDEILRENAP